MELQLSVERLAVGGDGIAHEPDGRVVFVSGSLPGEVVRVEVTSRGRDFWRASAVEVIEASPDRVQPPCPYVALGCGGCGWQYVSPDAQVILKETMVADALARQGGLRSARTRIGRSVSATGYRTGMRFGVSPDGRLGLRRAASHELVHMAECPVAHPALSSMIPNVRAVGAEEVALRVSAATAERTAVIVAGRPSAALGGLDTSVAVGPEAAIHEVVAGRSLRVSAASFFQSGAQSAGLLVDAVTRAAGDTSVVHRWADLYSGIGLFAATILRDVPVVTVELSGSSCADARVNLADRPVVLVEGDVDRWIPEPVDLVVADPARAGLGRGGVASIAGTGAGTVVLVSCDAAALGRDTRLLSEAGYHHVESEVLDLFPGTSHVEVVTRFERSVG
jgi:23S rRNA (uracil1939-C5)-methyltransferase